MWFQFILFLLQGMKCSDIYKIKESPNGILFEVQGKDASPMQNIDDSLLGANASAEVQDDVCESSTVSGVDIVLNHKLQETSFTKDSYKGYIKDCMKTCVCAHMIKAKLEENNPDGVKPFTTGAQEEIKMIMGNMKNYQSMNPDGMVGLLDIRKDGITPFKDGLEMEKCASPFSSVYLCNNNTCYNQSTCVL
uniref:Tumor protein, translationally-controlled 1 n=1 Tax=Salmo trutta TaxID=8032 RepID=A0A674CNC6_SALTR